MKTIFGRISDILSANINTIIDEAENPEVMLRQIIREMEQNLSDAKKDVTTAIAAEKRLERELDIHRISAEKWLRRAETSLKAGNEGLAKDALACKAEHDSTATSLSRSLDTARQASEALKYQLKRMCRKLEEARGTTITLKARQRSAQARMRISYTLDSFEKAHTIQQKFDHMASKVLDLEAQAEAMAEIDKDSAASCRSYDAMEMDIVVKGELAALKEKMSMTESK